MTVVIITTVKNLNFKDYWKEILVFVSMQCKIDGLSYIFLLVKIYDNVERSMTRIYRHIFLFIYSRNDPNRANKNKVKTTEWERQHKLRIVTFLEVHIKVTFKRINVRGFNT